MHASPRRLVASITALLLTVLAVSAPVLAEPGRGDLATLRPVPARPAADLVDSIGVGVHLGFLDTPYVETDRVLAALQDLGVRHVRDELRLDQPRQWEALRALGDAGIDSDLIVGPRPDQAGQLAGADPRTHVRVLARELADSVVMVEGLNEWDLWGGESWAQDVRAWQRGLHDAVRAEPALDDVAVLAPSVTWPWSWPVAGRFPGDADRENAHLYPDGREPGAVMRRKLDRFRSAHPDRPLVLSESGYNNAVGPASAETVGHPPVPEGVAGVYLPRLVVGAFVEGVERTYLHELLDQFDDPERVRREDNFGLLRHDWSPKPAYLALRQLLRLASAGDDGTTDARAGSLTVGVDGATDDLHRLVLRRADGSHLVLLWRDVSVWDVRTRSPVPVDAVDLTLRLGEAARWSVRRLGAPGTDRGAGDAVPVTLGARMAAVVVEAD